MNRRGVGDNGEGTLVLLFVALTPIICSAGILDPWQWARSDRIEVNIPWLPCNHLTLNIQRIEIKINQKQSEQLLRDNAFRYKI